MLRQKNEAGAVWVAQIAIEAIACRGMTPWTASLREDDLGQSQWLCAIRFKGTLSALTCYRQDTPSEGDCAREGYVSLLAAGQSCVANTCKQRGRCLTPLALLLRFSG